MKPDPSWIHDWKVGINNEREKAVSQELVTLFAAFLEETGIYQKSKKTQYRYESSLHALGGFLVEKAVWGDEDKTTRELLTKYVDPYEGPLIFQDKESWQEEVDMVCRKLYKYLHK